MSGSTSNNASSPTRNPQEGSGAGGGNNTGLKYKAEGKEFWHQLCVLYEANRESKYGDRMSIFLGHPDSGGHVKNENSYKMKMSRYYKQFKAGTLKFDTPQRKRNRKRKHAEIEDALIRKLKEHGTLKKKRKIMREMAMKIAVTAGKKDTFKASDKWLDTVLKRMDSESPSTCSNSEPDGELGPHADINPRSIPSPSNSPDLAFDDVKPEGVSLVAQGAQRTEGRAYRGVDDPNTNYLLDDRLSERVDQTSIEYEALHGPWEFTPEQVGKDTLSDLMQVDTSRAGLVGAAPAMPPSTEMPQSTLMLPSTAMSRSTVMPPSGRKYQEKRSKGGPSLKHKAEENTFFWYQLCKLYDAHRDTKYDNCIATFLDHPDSRFHGVRNEDKYRIIMSWYYKQFKAGKVPGTRLYWSEEILRNLDVTDLHFDLWDCDQVSVDDECFALEPFTALSSNRGRYREGEGSSSIRRRHSWGREVSPERVHSDISSFADVVLSTPTRTLDSEETRKDHTSKRSQRQPDESAALAQRCSSESSLSEQLTNVLPSRHVRTLYSQESDRRQGERKGSDLLLMESLFSKLSGLNV